VILYHFTSHDALESIRQEGIDRGEAPMSDQRVTCAVNLTTDPSPTGHGLDNAGHVVTAAESADYAARFGWDIAAGTVFVNKRAVRIKIRMPSSDRALKAWRTWSRKHCEPGYAERLEAAAGPDGKAKTWWLYFGTVPPSAFMSIDILEHAD
jgi:hypothetical protein